jgi:hypothetical protein
MGCKVYEIEARRIEVSRSDRTGIFSVKMPIQPSSTFLCPRQSYGGSSSCGGIK